MRLFLAAGPLVLVACQILPGGMAGPTPTHFAGEANEPGSATPTPMPAFFGPIGPERPVRHFVSVSRTHDGQDAPFVDGRPIDLWYADDGHLGVTGCNHMGFEYTLVDGRLMATPTGQSLIGCGPAGTIQDSDIARFVESDPTFDLAGESLVLASGGTVITFAERIQPPPTPRIRFVGILDRASHGNDEINVPASLISSVTFLDDGSVSWEIGDCGSGGATYVGVDNHTITFTDAGIDSSCTDETATVEEAVTSVLSTASVEYRVDSGNLSLSTPDTELEFRSTADD